jgi:hypothetical protein
MKSNLISFFVIRLFYSNFSILQNEYKHQFKQKYCNWTTFKIDSIIDNNLVEFYPFYRNTNSLFNEIKADKATLLILPTVLNKNDKHVRESGRYRQLTEFNNQISVQLGKEIGGVVIPFSFDSIQQNDCWIDDCHLNLVGEKRKAQLIYPYVAKILENSFGNN